MTAAARRYPTEPLAFVAWENRQKRRYELVGGEVRLMSGGSAGHDLIATNLITALGTALAGRPCFVHGSNLKLRSPIGMVTYPDLFVRCGQPLDDEALEATDPILIVEVLSPSTRGVDLVTKRWAYQAIPSLQALIYVETRISKVEIVIRAEDGSWTGRFIESRGASIFLPLLEASLTIDAIYSGTRVA